MANKLWLCLINIPELGSSTIKRLYDHFGSVGSVFGASGAELCKVEGITKKQVNSILSTRRMNDPAEELKKTKRFNFVTLDDPDYPEKLKNTYDPPPVLFHQGDIKTLSKRAIAIVGTRKPSSYGSESARRFASELVRLGFVIVSGMAYGIDSEAHRGCLDAGGETVAVFGCGIDKIYPSENIRLAQQISKSGCLISEYFPGTPSTNWTFPRRNRIISGLSLGVVVIEGGMDSGSLITAKLALDQGREVFAVPGHVDSQNSKGPHWLIKQGAKLVDSVEDILDELNIPFPKERAGPAFAGRDLSGLPEGERRICEALSLEPMHIDQLVCRTGLSVQEVSSLLLMLEVKGAVRELGGKTFALR